MDFVAVLIKNMAHTAKENKRMINITLITLVSKILGPLIEKNELPDNLTNNT